MYNLPFHDIKTEKVSFVYDHNVLINNNNYLFAASNMT